MILYNPANGDVQVTKVVYKPRTCFLMTQLGGKIPSEATQARQSLKRILKKHQIELIDASSEVTGKDFLVKIWKQIVSVPLCVAIIHRNTPPRTLCNIFYEVGMAQALGKEVLIIKTQGAEIPSDFVRTEYVSFDENFASNFQKFLTTSFELADYHETVAGQLGNNPLLAIDYVRRAYLLSGKQALRKKARTLRDSMSLEGREGNCVEMLLSDF